MLSNQNQILIVPKTLMLLYLLLIPIIRTLLPQKTRCNRTNGSNNRLRQKISNRGNNTHNYLENTINKSKGFFIGESDNHNIAPKGKKSGLIETINDLDSTDLKDTFPVIYDRLSQFIERDCIVYAEKRVKLDRKSVV